MSWVSASLSIRRLSLCLLPLGLGVGAALVLLLLAGGPARPAYASTLTYPGCGATIQACIDGASAGDTILISADDYTESLTLSKAVSLTGALSSTTILHALPNTRVLTVTGAVVNSSVVISGLTFTGGLVTGTLACPDSCGGGILITDTAQPLLVNVRLISNTAAFDGGGLWTGGSIEADGSQFINNRALGAPVSYYYVGGNGGGLSASSANLVGSQFISNSALYGGGVQAFTLVMTGTQFTSNASTFGGGGAFAYSLVTTGTQFISNTTSGSGGGASTQLVNASGGLFEANSAAGIGGGLAMAPCASCGPDATLIGTQFISNTAAGDGGGLGSTTVVYLAGGRFQGNTAYSGGGIYANQIQYYWSGTQVVGNSATTNGGGIYAGCGCVTYPSGSIINGIQVMSNTAGTHGGGIDGRYLFVQDALVQNNTAGTQGGGIYAGGLYVSNTHVISNSAATAGGGAESTSLASVTASQFVQNQCTSAGCQGGGLVATVCNGCTGLSAILANTQFLSNTAGQGAGAWVTGTANLTGGLFQNNQAITGMGGGLVGSDAVAITGTTFLSNTSYAGATAISANTLTVAGGMIQGNQCSKYDCLGGGLSATTLSMSGTQVLSNTAGIVGGAFTYFATLNDVLFQGNRGTYFVDGVGGLVAADALTATNASFVNNAGAASGGGALAEGTITFLGGLFQGNSSPGAGGGLYTSGKTALTGTEFIANVASAGGGLYASTDSSGGSLRLVNALFAGNSSSTPGSALEVAPQARMTATVLHTTFTSSTLSGGTAIAIAGDGMPYVAVTDTIISNYAVGLSTIAGTAYEDYNLYFGTTTQVTGAVTSGGHSLTGDPAFANAAGGNYHLTASSVALDAGTDAGVSADFEGDPRPQGTGFDIGYDESPYTAAADMNISKSASAGSLQPGQAVTYTLVFSNSGPNVASGVRLTDSLPVNVINPSYLSSGAALTPVVGPTYAWQVVSLAPGTGGVVTITGVLGAAPAGTAFTNTATITTSVVDSSPANNTGTASVTILNAPPVASDDAYSLVPDGVLTVTAPGVLANDSDANGDELTAALVAGPLTGTLDFRSTGAFTYTPPLGFSGPVTFSYKANDGSAHSNTAVVTITVAAAADVRIVQSASGSLLAPGARLTYTLAYINAGSVLAAGVRLTDIVPANLTIVTYTSSGPGLTPVGGQTYVWQVADLAPGAGGLITVTGVVSGARGAVFTNTATLTTTTTDSNSANNTSTVSVTVANAAPAATADAYSLYANGTLKITPPGVLANDTDANGDALTAVLANGVATGTLALAPTGAFTYSPPLGFAGVVTFTYKANDGLADSNPATATITVTDQAIGGLSAASGSPRALGSATPFTASISAGTHVTYGWSFGDGSTVGSGATTSHAYNALGVYTAVVTATNSTSQVTGTTVVTVDDVPSAAGDGYTTLEDTPLYVLSSGVLANDTDTFPGGLTAQVVAGPVTGTLLLAPSGAFTYTPPLNFNGGVTFTYRASDGIFNSLPALVTVTVQPVNDSPTIGGLQDVTTTVGAAAGPLSFTVGEVETPAGALTLTAESSNAALVPVAGIQFGGSGAARTVTITPAAGTTGTATITVRVSDGVAVTSLSFVVTVIQAGQKVYLPLLWR